MAGRIVRTAVLVLIWLGSGVAAAAADAGPWTWPLGGPHEVSRAFDPPASHYGIGHRGVDLPGVAGQDVRAAGAGRVSYAGLIAGRGVVVVVHGELRTTYEPVTAVVSVDDVVEAGQPIGTLDDGHLGCPFEACLHWGLKRGEDYLDPVGLVERGPARLLPLGAEVARPAAAALRAPADQVPADRERLPFAPIVAPPSPAAERAVTADTGADAEAWPRRRTGEAVIAATVLLAGVGVLRGPRGPTPGAPVDAATQSSLIGGSAATSGVSTPSDPTLAAPPGESRAAS